MDLKKFFQARPAYWVTPGGEAQKLYADILFNEPHILIAGATGSGKSVLINTLTARLLMTENPDRAKLILIDPKRVELHALQVLPHCIGYADTPQGATHQLTRAVELMEGRYKELQRDGLKKWTRGAVYVIIDEYADLMTTAKKEIEPLITRLVQLGRAADVHLIIATQRPTREVISGAIRVNLDCKIALHCATAQDSRNVIGTADAARLPRFGSCFILNADGLQGWRILPLDDKLPELVRWWTSSNCKRATA